MKLLRGKTSVGLAGRGYVLTFYTPWLSKERERVELGFNIRVRDLRPWKGGRRQWRWLKVFIGWTNPRLVDERGRYLIAEIETHRTDGALGRTTYKTFVRLKCAVGAGKKS